MSCCRCVCNSSSAAVFFIIPLFPVHWESLTGRIQCCMQAGKLLYEGRELHQETWNIDQNVFFDNSFLQCCFWLILDLWLYLIDGGHWVGYFNLCWGKEKLMLVSKSSLFYFIFFLTRASLRVSYLTAFDSSLKENHAHVVMSSVLSFTATFWNVTLLFIAQPRPCCHLSQELQGAVLCTELSMSL